ncbi:MAG: hypothetical protein QOJ13_2352 [Gaiellales bacterium]|nr:hypothetical protein [Gaiellales bacterium]
MATRLRGPLLNVVIVDSRGFDRLALSLLCREDPALRVVAMAEDLQAACHALSVRKGEAVALVGDRLLRDAGAMVVGSLRLCGGDVRVLMVGVGEEEEMRREATRLGVDGVLQRDGDSVTQLAAIWGATSAVPRWGNDAPLSRPRG